MENENNTAKTAAATSTEQSTAQTESKAVPSFEELLKNKDYQSEFDRRVTKALETAKANWEREEQAKQTEAKRLAEMNEEQKAEHKRQQAEKQLAEREAAVTKRELTATAKEQLIEKGFPPELSDVLDYSGAEKSVFQSTPARTGRPEVRETSLAKIKISIHTPRERGDVHTALSSLYPALFQSTPRANGATASGDVQDHAREISIHAPRERGDPP